MDWNKYKNHLASSKTTTSKPASVDWGEYKKFLDETYTNYRVSKINEGKPKYESNAFSPKNRQQVAQTVDFSDNAKRKQEILGYDDFKKYSIAGLQQSVIDKSNTNNKSYKVYKAANQGRDDSYLRKMMDKDEEDIYNYYLGKFGKEEAEKYFESIAEEMGHRYAELITGKNKDNVVNQLIYGAAAGLENFKEGTKSGLKMLAGNDEVQPTTAYEYGSQMTRENLGDTGPDLGGVSLGQVGYDLVTNTANMLPSMAIGLVTAGLGGSVAMGLSAAGNTYQQDLKDGYTEEEAWKHGALVGAAEGALQYIFGGIGALGGKFTTKTIGKFMPKLKSALARVAVKVPASMASEGFEEYSQEILDTVFRNWIFDENNDIDLLSEEAIYSGILGALTAGFIEGPSVAVNESIKADYDQRFESVKAGLREETASAETQYTDDEISEMAENIMKVMGGTATEENITEFAGSRDEKAVAERIMSTGRATSDFTIRKDAENYLIEQGVGLKERLTASGKKQIEKANKMLAEERQTQNRDTVLKNGFTEEQVQNMSTEEVAQAAAEIKKAEKLSTETQMITELSKDESEGYQKVISEAYKDYAQTDEPFKMDAEDFANEFSSFYDIGKAGVESVDRALEAYGKGDPQLTNALARAYELGKGENRAENIAQAEIKQQAAKKGVKGKIVFEGNVKNRIRNKQQAEAINFMANVLKDTTNMEYHIFASYEKNGERYYKNSNGNEIKAPNGFYDPDTHQIWIDVNAGSRGQGIMLYTLTHEHVHDIRVWSPEHYNNLLDIAVQTFEAEGMDFEKAAQDKYKSYIKNHPNYTMDAAREEVVADMMSGLLSNEKGLAEFSKQIQQKDASLWNRIKAWFKDVIARITKAYEDTLPESYEARMLMENKELFEKVQKVFAEAVATAGQNYKAYSEMENFQVAGVEVSNELSVNDVIESGGSNGVVAKFQERTEYEEAPKQIFTISTTNGTSTSKMLTNKDGSNKLVSVKELRDQKFKENHFTVKEIDKMNNFIKGLADYMKEARVKYRFIGLQDVYDAKIVLDPMTNSIVLSAMVKNSEYSVNFDFTKICKKRVALQEVIEQLTREKGKKNEDGSITEVDLSPANIKSINDILAKMGFETACLGCFVESKRYAMQNFYQDLVVDVWNRLVDEINPNAEYFGFADQNVDTSKIPDGEFFDLQKQSKAWAEKKGKAKDVEQKMREYLHDNPAARKKLTLADLATANGRTNLAKLYPHVNSLVKSKLGQSAPKSVEVFTPYNGEIELLEATGDGKLAEYLKKIGGARSQSFSDFIITHVFDVLQKTASLSARKFTAHTYTKEIVRAQLFGLTGEKHNLSVIHNVDPNVDSWNAGLGKNGQYLNADYEAYMKGESDFIQSIGVKDAIKWQNTEGYSRDIGIIAVGFSYNHMMKMHDDPEIRQIIGYHASQLPVDIKDKTHLGKAADYTHVQNTLRFKGFRVVNYKTPNGVPSYATPPQDIKEISGVKSLTKKTDLTFDIKAKFEENARGKTGKARTDAAKKTLRQFLDFADTNNLVPVVSKAEGALGEFDIYADSERTQNPYLTADHYIEYCMERGCLPAFFEFGLHQNYYKNIYDFDPFDRLSYNPITGLHEDSENRKAFAPQRPVHMLNEDGSLAFPDNFIEIVDKAMKGYDKQRRSETEMMPEAMEKIRAVTNTKFQDRDSDGRELSAEQVEFFKDSKVRDENGNLLTMYHGTNNDFWTFDTNIAGGKNGVAEGYGIYLTDRKDVANNYGSRKIEAYVNIVKPATSFKKTITASTLAKLIKDTCVREAQEFVDNGDYDNVKDALFDTWISNYVMTYDLGMEKAYKEAAKVILQFDNNDMDIIREVMAGMGIRSYVDAMDFYHTSLTPITGFDGFATQWEGNSKKSLIYLAFDSNQVKSVDNKTPTADPDIRYSDRDSDVDIDTQINMTRAWIDNIEDRLSDPFFAEENPKAANELRAKLESLYRDLRGELAEVRKQTKKTSLKTIHENLEYYSDLDIEGLANDISENNWDFKEEGLSRAEIIEGIREMLEEKMEDMSPLEQQSPKFGFYVRPVNKSEDIRYSLREVEPVQPASDKWQRTSTTSEVMARFPNLWNVAAEESETRNPTQITGTVKSYRKIYDFLKDEGFDGTILDASSGLGYGTRAGIEEYGFDVEDIEPYPDKNYHPKYKDYSKLNKKYDAIISNAVLNVIPQDQRDALVVKMGELLNEGGRMFINVRGKDVENASSKVAINKDLMEYYISNTGSYQKGFTKDELVAYLQDALGDGFTVEKSNMFGAVSAVVIKNEGQPLYQERLSAADQNRVVILEDQIKRLKADIKEIERHYEKAQDYARAEGILIGQVEQGKEMAKTIASKDAELRRKKESYERKAKNYEDMLEAKRAKIKEIRQRRDEILAEQKAAFKEYREQRNEAIRSGGTRKSIEKNAKTLMDWLLKNSDKEHVPEALKTTVGEFLETIDFTSKRGLAGGKPTKKDQAFAQKLNNLATMLEKQRSYMNNANEGDAENPLDCFLDLPEGFAEEIRMLADDVAKTAIGGNFVINDMNSEQLAQLNKALRVLKTSISKMNKLITNAHFASVTEAARNSMLEMAEYKAHKPMNDISEQADKMLKWEMFTPVYAFKRYGNAGESIFKGIQKGWSDFAFAIDKVLKFAEKTYTDKEVEAWEKETHSIKLSDGKTVTLTTAQLMSLYCLNKREQARGHIYGGGIRIADIKEGKAKIQQTEPYLVSFEDVETLISELSDRQIAVADKLQEFMTEQGSEWGNKVSMERFGYRAFTEENYFPIESDANNLIAIDPEAKANDMFRLLNMSATKSLTKGANNAIVISDIFDIFSNHMSDMAKYGSLALPILDTMKWYNYKVRYDVGDGQFRTETVQKSVERAYGKAGKSYFTNFMKDLNGVKEGGRGIGLVNKMVSNYKIASVGANLRVAVLQPTSIVRASMEIEPKYILQALTKAPAAKEAEKKSGIALWKSLGFYNTDIARGIRDQIKGGGKTIDKVRDKTMILAEKMDRITFGTLWNAAETKAKDLGYSGEELDAKTTEIFDNIIYKTQVVDSTLTRSSLMRSTNEAVKSITAFMAEPTLSYNMVAETVYDMAKERDFSTGWQKNSERFGKAVSIYAASSIAAAVIESVPDAFRDDDDDEWFGQKWWQAFWGERFWDGNLWSEINVLEKIPLLKDFISVRKGYDIQRLDAAWMSSLNKAIEINTELYNVYVKGEKPTKTTYWGNMTAYGAAYANLRAISQIAGLPVSNTVRDIVAIWNTIVGGMAPSLKVKTYDDSKKK